MLCGSVCQMNVDLIDFVVETCVRRDCAVVFRLKNCVLVVRCESGKDSHEKECIARY